MKFSIREQAAKVLSKRKKHSIYVLSVSIAAVFTVVGVVYGLTRPGRAFSSLQKTLECNAQAHTHTAECYDAEGNLICGMADYFAHVHDPELCYDENGDLVCPLPEIIPHEHDDSCYIERLELICGIEEGQVVDRNGNPVFDEAGNPLFDINAVPEIGSIEILGTVEDVTEAEVTEETDANQEVTEEGDNLEAAGETSEEAPAADVTEKATENGDSNAPAPDETPAEGTPAEGTPAEETPAEDAATDETTVQETPAESTTPDIIEETVDLGGAGADIAEGGYTTHVHTAECYRVVKELVCTIPALHVHTADCYDEDGKLICGQLQLSQHVHGEDCFVYEEKTVTKTAVAGDYTITATYGASAKIPSKAEFRAELISEGSDKYSENEEIMKNSLGDGMEAQVMFDIGFYVNGEEIEPEGPVDVKFTLNTEFETGENLSLIHVKNDGNVEVNDTVVDQTNNVSLTMDSFSVVILGTESSTFTPGYYKTQDNSNGHGGLGSYIGYVPAVDLSKGYGAFDQSDVFANYRTYNNELGIAANFHIVAFDTAKQFVHVNGNFCTKNFYSEANFGTQGLTNEINYIQNLQKPATKFGEDNSFVTVLGYNNKLEIEKNGEQYKIEVNDKGFVTPGDLYIEESSSTPFINLTKLHDDLVKYQGTLMTHKSENLVISSDKKTIKLSDPNSIGYLNITAQEFINDYANKDVTFSGIDKETCGTIIINIDCTDFKGTIYNQGTKKLSTHDFGHHTEFKDGKILWNFYNSKDVVFDNQRDFFGIVLAPDADVYLNGGNLDGQVIADYVEVHSESHRVTFTGSSVPVSAKIVFHKTVNGETPDTTQKFDFLLQEYNKGTWNTLQTVQNSGSNILFEDLSYGKPSDLGDHWYRIIEKTESAIDGKKYFYDNNQFIMKVQVELNGTNYESKQTFYGVSGEPTFTLDANGNIVNITNGSEITGEYDRLFDNTPKFTKITVTKKWVDYEGKDLVDDLPESLTVNLYRSKENEGAAFDAAGLTPFATVELNAANNWTYTWDELLTKDEADGKKFVYFVTEADTIGFEAVSRSRDSWFIQGTQEFVNKKNLENTYIEIDKQFFGFNLNGEKTLLDNPDPKNNPDAYIKVRLDQVKVDADGNEIGTAIPYSGSCKISGNATTITDGVFKITARDGWKMRIDELPKVVVDKNGNISYYKYLVTELECSLGYGVDGDPICRGTEETDTDGNVFTLFTLKNILLPTELEIDKKWFTYLGTPDSLQSSDTTDVTIDVGLSRFDKDGNAKEIGTITVGALSYKVSAKTVNQAFEVTGVTENNAPKKWAVKVTKLPAYYVATDADGKTYLEKYSYKVSEKPITSIADYVLVDIAVSNGEQIVIPGSVLDSNLKDDGTYSTIVINNRSTSTFQLPETGGRGRNFTAFYIVGALMLLGSVALLIYRKRL